MGESMHALYTLQDIGIVAGFKDSTEYTQIRAQLKGCWDDAKELLQECFSITSTVALMEDAAAENKLMVSLLKELVEGCKKCHTQAQDLANQHLRLMERYNKFETTLRSFARGGKTSDGDAMSEAMSKFTTAYKMLQKKLDDMVTFFTGEVQVCNLYLLSAEGKERAVPVDEAEKFTMEWKRLRPIIKRAKTNVGKFCEAVIITPPGTSLEMKHASGARAMILPPGMEHASAPPPGMERAIWIRELWRTFISWLVSNHSASK
jgi:hypothetical protein